MSWGWRDLRALRRRCAEEGCRGRLETVVDAELESVVDLHLLPAVGTDAILEVHSVVALCVPVVESLFSDIMGFVWVVV